VRNGGTKTALQASVLTHFVGRQTKIFGCKML
jgi:hypothetical protein